jgi:hypothetical protein
MLRTLKMLANLLLVCIAIERTVTAFQRDRRLRR